MCTRERKREQYKCVASERVFCLYFTFLKIFQPSLSVYHIGRVFVEAVCTVAVSAISRALTLAYRYMANECRLANTVIATVCK